MSHGTAQSALLNMPDNSPPTLPVLFFGLCFLFSRSAWLTMDSGGQNTLLFLFLIFVVIVVILFNLNLNLIIRRFLRLVCQFGGSKRACGHCAARSGSIGIRYGNGF